MTVIKPVKPAAGLRLLAALAALVLLGMLWLPAQASESRDPNGVWNDYNAEDVDLSTIREDAGGLTGYLKILRYRDKNQVLKVDCPVPQAFTEEQLRAITVEFASFEKDILLAAMEKADGIGKSGLKVKWDMHSRTNLLYAQAGAPEEIWPDFIDNSLAASTLGSPVEKPDEQARAKNIAIAFAKELGFEPYLQGMNIDRVYTSVPRGLQLTISGYEERFLKNRRSRNRNLQEFGHKSIEESDLNYTAVSLLPMLRGLPIAPQYAWPLKDAKEPDARLCRATQFDLLVKDSGGICYVKSGNLPREVSAAPLAIAPVSWQDALKEWMATYYVDDTTTVDVVYDADRPGNTWGTYTEYATYRVLTEIKPVYVSMSKLTYTPGWCFVVEERLTKDDTLVNAQTYTLDMVTMGDPFYSAYP